MTEEQRELIQDLGATLSAPTILGREFFERLDRYIDARAFAIARDAVIRGFSTLSHHNARFTDLESAKKYIVALEAAIQRIVAVGRGQALDVDLRDAILDAGNLL